jgi:cytoskeleton protein RodZ
VGQLGDLLKERRMALGISLTQAEESTRIRAKLLEALENGEYDRLPNPGYVKGYVSSYASYLELDSASLLAIYRAETGVGGRSRDISPAEEAVKPRGQQHAVPLTAAIIAVVVLAVLSLGIWAVVRAVRGPETPPPIPSAGSQTSTASAGSTGTSSPAVSPTTQTSQPVSPNTPFTLKLAVAKDGASYFRVTVDGLKAYEGSMAGGQSKEFQVTKQAVVRIGKPSYVTVYRDGKKVPIPPGGGTPTMTLKAQPAQ